MNGGTIHEKLILSYGLIMAAMHASRAYHRCWGDGVMKLRASKNIIYATRNWRAALMGDPCLSGDHKVELSCLEVQHLQALCHYCAAQGRGRVKEGSTSSGDGERGARQWEYDDPESNSVSITDEEDWDYADSENGSDEDVRPVRKCQKIE